MFIKTSLVILQFEEEWRGVDVIPSDVLRMDVHTLPIGMCVCVSVCVCVCVCVRKCVCISPRKCAAIIHLHCIEFAAPPLYLSSFCVSGCM